MISWMKRVIARCLPRLVYVLCTGRQTESCSSMVQTRRAGHYAMSDLDLLFILFLLLAIWFTAKRLAYHRKEKNIFKLFFDITSMDGYDEEISVTGKKGKGK